LPQQPRPRLSAQPRPAKYTSRSRFQPTVRENPCPNGSSNKASQRTGFRDSARPRNPTGKRPTASPSHPALTQARSIACHPCTRIGHPIRWKSPRRMMDGRKPSVPP